MSHALFDKANQEQYEEQGFLVVPGLISKAELSVYRERFNDIVNDRVDAHKSMLVMRDVMVAKGEVEVDEPASAIAKLQDFHHDTVLLDRYVRNPQILDWVEAIIGTDIKSIHTMLINKPPNVDGRHPLHQDLLYFPFRPADLIVASWTAIDPATKENGCLVVVPGTHKGELLEHENPDWDFVNFAYFAAKGVGPDERRIHLEMDPGDTVFFHPLLLHGSGRNRTPGFRKSISSHYANSSCRYINDSHPLKSRDFILVRGKSYEDCI